MGDVQGKIFPGGVHPSSMVESIFGTLASTRGHQKHACPRPHHASKVPSWRRLQPLNPSFCGMAVVSYTSTGETRNIRAQLLQFC